MMRRFFTLLTAVFAVLVLSAAPALAHEERDVGKYSFRVGFGQEPAYAGVPNSAQLLLFDKSDKPITGLRDELNVEVGFGDQNATYPVEPAFEVGEFGTPGDYRAWFIPTRAGRYSFHFIGSVNGQKVDETFTSGPKTFDDVEDPTSVEFPVQDPTVGELADRIGREVPRLDNSIDEVRSATAVVADDASSASTLAVIALVVGSLGVLVGIVALVALVRGRRAVG
jgi:hypothetical protein